MNALTVVQVFTYSRPTRTAVPIYVVLVLATAATALVTLGIGPVTIAPQDVARAVLAELRGTGTGTGTGCASRSTRAGGTTGQLRQVVCLGGRITG